MDYTHLDADARQQILNGHIAQHQADHFQADLNLAKATAAGDEDSAREWTLRRDRAASDAAVAAARLAELDSAAPD